MFCGETAPATDPEPPKMRYRKRGTYFRTPSCASGTVGDSAGFGEAVCAKSIAGVVTLLPIVEKYGMTDQDGWNATFVVSGTNVLVVVTGEDGDSGEIVVTGNSDSATVGVVVDFQ